MTTTGSVGTPGEIHFIDNGAGWRLALKRIAPPAFTKTPPRPVLIVPGYGMNCFIFGFHPRGLSLEAYLASRGLEVWSVDLRGQGRAVKEHGEERYGFGELAVDDLGCAIAHVQRSTRTGHDKIDLIGASLGTALAFGHLACVPEAPVHSVINMGGLVTWVKVPTILRAAFSWPWLVERVRMKDTRKLAGKALPALVKWAPQILSMYLNATSTDTTQAAVMIQTVEDPNPYVNGEIAQWIKQKDLVIRGVNVSQALSGMTYPHLSVIANNDGIVPPETARAVYAQLGSRDKEMLAVGDKRSPIAHADLFLSTGSQEKIFAPMADFLIARS